MKLNVVEFPGGGGGRGRGCKIKKPFKTFHGGGGGGKYGYFLEVAHINILIALPAQQN